MLSHSKKLIILGCLLVFIDQFTKIYVKTHFYLGEEVSLIGTWFNLHFIENEGMAYGLKFSEGKIAKIALSIFRLLAISYAFFYFIKHILPKKNILLNYVIVIILAGAIGNLIDSLFYEMCFTPSPLLYSNEPLSIFSIAKSKGNFLEGKVVDMFYFPLYRGKWASWIPFLANKPFEFFAYIFNFADSCISIGVGLFILFNKKFSGFLSKKNH